MRMLKILIPAMLIVVVLVIVGWGLQNVTLDEFEVTGITDITPESFTFSGSFILTNPSMMSLPVEAVTYDVLVNNEVISQGVISAFTLERGETTVPFEQEIFWVPATERAVSIITEGDALLEVRGELRIGIPILRDYAVPFSDKTNVQAYLRQFLPVDVSVEPEGILEEDLLDDLQEEIAGESATGAVAETLTQEDNNLEDSEENASGQEVTDTINDLIPR